MLKRNIITTFLTITAIFSLTSCESIKSSLSQQHTSQEPTLTSNPNVTSTPKPTFLPQYTPSATPEEDATSSSEIVFRDIPWGTSYTTLVAQYPDYTWLPLAGDIFVTPSVDGVLLDNDYEGIEFEYTDININASIISPDMEVAGYTAEDIELYFAYTTVDGTLPKTENFSALYGARYRINPVNLTEAKNDLINKLIQLYGDPRKETKDSDWSGLNYTYTYWYGQNNTELVLKTTDASADTSGLFKNTISISYAWRNGDELLQNASDCLKSLAADSEQNIYGNNSTNGL
nr:MAG TPA: hypothetical protein [Caudoviricetes sp.]